MGGVQFHARIAGLVGEIDAMVCAAPIGFQLLRSVEFAGKAVQKSAGRFGRPAVAFA